MRPLPDSGICAFGRWVADQTWDDVYAAETAHSKAELLQKSLIGGFNYFIPEKTIKFRHDDKPWVNQEIKQCDRQQRRAWIKNKHSSKYKDLHKKYLFLCKIAKKGIITTLS